MTGSQRANGGAVSCDVFDSQADELALGLLDEPLRTALLSHAAGCPACRGLLDELAAVGDTLLLAAPELEPPAGFEGRVLDRMPAAVGRAEAATDSPGARPRPRPAPAEPAASGRGGRRWLVPTVAALALVVGAVAATAVASGQSASDGGPRGAIVTASGQKVGEIRLITEPVPHLLITIPSPQGAPGVRFCELQRPDGSWVRVGSWEAVDLASGVWAAGIDPSLLDATTMRVVTDQGVLLATATLG